MKKLMFALLAFCLFGKTALAVRPVAEQKILAFFDNAVAYSHQDKFSKSIQDVFLVFDREGNAVGGVAYRLVSPWDFHCLLILERNGGTFTIREVSYPDIDQASHMYPPKRKKIMTSKEKAEGMAIHADGKDTPVDAVTGATRFHKRIYIGINLMAKKLVELIQSPPAWDKKIIRSTDQ